ncbi:MAG: hypothetical protein ABIQ95_00140, partial [Bdellovibrionia bacterium]
MKNHEQSNAEKEWENLLDPRALKSRLIFFSLYIASYEHLKSCIVDRIKDFFTHGFDESGWKVDSKYQAELRGTGKKHLTEQSVAWLQKMNAIDA